MNETISNIIEQQSSSYSLGLLSGSQIDLDERDILLGYRGDKISIASSQELADGDRYRLSLIMPYIQNYINKYGPKTLDLIISLGDVLKKSYSGIPTICLSKHKDVAGILIPNIDFFTGVIHITLKHSNNDILYDEKNNSSIFAGSSTGSFQNNTRILYGQKCLDSTTHFCHITNLCQADHSEWIKEYPFIDSLVTSELDIKKQLSHKVSVNIDGNTVCWSRLYWQMNSNSIPVYINKTDKDIQFFDYADSSDCYVECSLENSIETINSVLNSYSSDQIEQINLKGKNFCNTCFGDYLTNPQQFLQDIINDILSKISNLNTQ